MQGNLILSSESEYRSRITPNPSPLSSDSPPPDFQRLISLAGFNANRRSVDMFSAACPTLPPNTA